MRALLVVLALTLAGCSQSPGTPEAAMPPPPAWFDLPDPSGDPLGNGPWTWETSDYDLGEVKVGGPDANHEGYAYDARIRGTLTLPNGTGPFPLAVFLHGQHTTCAGPNGEEGGDCSQAYRNDRGYVYLMEHLASHGIATASILAHEINNENGAGDTGMWARGELVLATIEGLNASAHAGVLDFTRIGLMGHSRGGEGVVTAVEVNHARSTPWPLAAVIALAPTDFAYRAVPNVPFLTLAPYCDGDVYSLHGLRQFDQSRFVDDTAVKVQLLVMGANHNNYNTMWGRGWTNAVTADGDDADFGRHQNTHCDLRREDGGGRLSLPDTYAQAILHMGGFLRWVLLGHHDLAPYFLGSPQASAACPDQAPACPGAVHVSTMTPGRRDLFHVESTGPVGAPGVAPEPFGSVTQCQMTDCAQNVYSSAWMLDVDLLPDPLPPSGLVLRFDAPIDLRATPVLHVRIGVPTDQSINAFGPPRMAVTFQDGTGSVTVAVDDPALFLPPGLVVDGGVGALGLAYVGGAKVAANAVRIALPDGIDAGNVTAIALSFTGAGPLGPLPDRILVADAWMNRVTATPFASAALLAPAGPQMT